MKKILILSLIISLYSCNKKDPFESIEYGKADYDKTLNFLLKEDIVNEPDRDSLSFRSFIETSNSKIPVEVYLNPDRYNFGSIRQIQISLNSDTIYPTYQLDPYFLRGGAPRLYSEVESVYRKYEERYGEPDSLFLTYPFKASESGLSVGEFFRRSFLSQKLDSTAIPGKMAYWNTENFILEFDIPIPVPDIKRDSLLYVNFASIKYSMINYDDRIRFIRDSIRKKLTPKDLISMEVYQPIWNELYGGQFLNKSLKINVGSVMRIDKEEDRAIVAVKFDIVFRDLFKKELYRFEDVIFEPQSPLMKGSNGLVKHDSYPVSYTIDYNSNTRKGRELDDLKNHSKTNKIRINYQINSIVFDDGSVLGQK